MIKEKTITIKQVVYKDGGLITTNGKKYYPVYTQIIYNRTSTRFKTEIDGQTFSIQEGMGIEELNLNNIVVIGVENERIRKILRYEIELVKGKFKLKGFGNRYKYYTGDILNLLEIAPKIVGLEKHLKTCMIYEDFIKWKDLEYAIEKIYFILNIQMEKPNLDIIRSMPSNIHEFITNYNLLFMSLGLCSQKGINLYDVLFSEQKNNMNEVFKKENLLAAFTEFENSSEEDIRNINLAFKTSDNDTLSTSFVSIKKHLSNSEDVKRQEFSDSIKEGVESVTLENFKKQILKIIRSWF